MAATPGSHCSSSSRRMCVVLGRDAGRTCGAGASLAPRPRLFLLSHRQSRARRGKYDRAALPLRRRREPRELPRRHHFDGGAARRVHLSDQGRDEPRAARGLHPAAARLGIRRSRRSQRPAAHRRAPCTRSPHAARRSASFPKARSTKAPGLRAVSSRRVRRCGARQTARGAGRDPRRAMEAAARADSCRARGRCACTSATPCMPRPTTPRRAR